jgi:HlyD family secretion protein
MATKTRILIPLLLVILLVAAFAIYFLNRGTQHPQYATANAVRKEIRIVVNTNGIIEPADRSEIYSPINAFVARIPHREGSNIAKGQLLIQLESRELRAALAEARAALLQQKRQARAIMTGPLKEEISELDASIAECEMQLEQQQKDLRIEEFLYEKGATPRVAVENLQKERDLLQLRLDALKQKKLDFHQRYSAEEKEWEQDKVLELIKQVNLLEQQLKMEFVLAPESGLIYSLLVKQGSYVTDGQLLAQIYQPGNIRLRAYVDEPDLGKIEPKQPVVIKWDGLPNQEWTGMVDKQADQVVALDNRSVGHVLCSIDGDPKELIPNLNVDVEITTAAKENALVVPRSSVFSNEGEPAVLLAGPNGTITKPVTMGLFTSQEIEILDGINEGDSIVLYPAETRADQ